MSFWTAIVAIVAIVTLSEMYRARLKTGLRKSEERFEDLSQRMGRLEERMSNIETIVVDREKQDHFRDLN